MKSRHWERIAKLTGHTFDVESDSFLLRNIMEAPILPNKDEIEVRVALRIALWDLKLWSCFGDFQRNFPRTPVFFDVKSLWQNFLYTMLFSMCLHALVSNGFSSYLKKYEDCVWIRKTLTGQEMQTVEHNFVTTSHEKHLNFLKIIKSKRLWATVSHISFSFVCCLSCLFCFVPRRHIVTNMYFLWACNAFKATTPFKVSLGLCGGHHRLLCAGSQVAIFEVNVALVTRQWKCSEWTVYLHPSINAIARLESPSIAFQVFG